MQAAIEQYWSFFAVATMIYFIGQVSKRVLKKLVDACAAGKVGGVRRHIIMWWDFALPVLPLAAGWLLGYVPWPVPSWMGDGVSHNLWFMLGGALAETCFRVAQRTIERVADVRAAATGSIAPPAPAQRTPAAVAASVRKAPPPQNPDADAEA